MNSTTAERKQATQTNGIARKDDIVTYEDMANPRTAYLVLQVPSLGSDYALRNMDSGELIHSDLRQNGWTTWTNIASEVGR